MKSIETGREVPLEAREAIGERMLGQLDPRGMTQEEFERAPDLLFHGSATPFEFRNAFDYRSEGYIRENRPVAK